MLKTENTENAEKELKNFLKQKPDSEWALLELSQLKLKQEQFAEAEKLLNRGLLKYKDSPGFTAGSGSFVQNSATMAGSGKSLSETAEITSTQFSVADTLGLYAMETK